MGVVTMIKHIKDEIDKIKAALIMKTPFLYSLIARSRICISSQIDTAAVDRNYTIYINPKKFMNLDVRDRVYILSHETLHIALNHLNRRERREPVKWNIATDAVVNTILDHYIRRTNSLRPVDMTTIAKIIDWDGDIGELRRMSAEEIYELIKGVDVPLNLSMDLVDGNIESDGVVQEGDADIYSSRDISRKWRDALYRAYVIQREAGNIPACLERIIDGLFRPGIPWYAKLRVALRDGLGRSAVSTWIRLNRKLPYVIPGVKMVSIPTTWVLVDTSGSISVDMLKQFISEVYAIARQTEVKVVCWDAKAYDIIPARSSSEVISRVAKMIRGGGGTVIAPALKKTLRRMKPMDIVVVFTDGDISDIGSRDTMELLGKVALKSSKAIFVTTYVEHSIPMWDSIKLEVGSWK